MLNTIIFIVIVIVIQLWNSHIFSNLSINLGVRFLNHVSKLPILLLAYIALALLLRGSFKYNIIKHVQ